MEFLHYLVIYSVFFITSFFLGQFVFFLLKIRVRKFFTSFFAKTLTGTTLLITLFSVVTTFGLTIHLGILLVGIFLLWELFSVKASDHPQHENPDKSAIIGNIILIKLILIGMFFCFWKEMSGIENMARLSSSLHRDYFWLARMSYFLGRTGVENVSNVNNLYNDSFRHVAPYHYFESWLNYGLTSIFKLNSLFSDRLLVLPILGSFVFLGFVSIAEQFLSSRIMMILFALLSVYFIGFLFSDMFAFMDKFKFNALSNPKYSVQYIWLIAGIILFLNNKTNTAILVLLILPVASIATAPGIFSSLVLLSLFQYWKEKEVKKLLQRLFYIFSVFLFIVLFYSAGHQEPAPVASDAGSLNVYSYNNFSSQGIRTIIYLIGSSLTQLCIIYSPYVLCFLFLAWNYRNEILGSDSKLFRIIIFAFSAFFSSLIVWVCISNLENAWELFTNISVCLINILIPLMVLWIFSSKRWNYFLLVIMLLFIYNSGKTAVLKGWEKAFNNFNWYKFPVDQKYYSDASNYFSAHPGYSKGGLWIDPKDQDYDERNRCGVLSYNLFDQGTFLSFIRNDLSLVPLFVCDTNSISEHSPFSMFLEKQRVNKNYISIDSSRRSFIFENSIGFLLLSQNAGTEGIAGIDTIFTNQTSGEKLVFLRPVKKK